jgi:hypothetical protein
MRQITIGILYSAAFLASSCNKHPEDQSPEAVNAAGEVANAAQAYYTVQADEITDAKITALQGTFQMLNATAANGIPSTGGGGACLVFRAKDLGFTTMDGKKCSSNSDCTVLPPPTVTDPTKPEFYSYVPDPANPSHKEARFGYCDKQNKQCWAKPITNNGGNAVCNRPIIMTPGTVNQVPKNPPAPGTGPIDVSQWVNIGDKVRIVACLQKTGAVSGISPVGTGCASSDGPDRIEVMGKPATLHK